ncbi:helix-turn-helix transcriptional regulator [Pseudoalteromonas sp. N1230-9]|uniref:helix-turn-helix domain-containing protein n=1 Tax=Pseudoalteromonas sp. N1230-9 TaxID=2907156 RepID=UPI002B2EE710|nr:helix-turn-helix transcriptional regulator [Pseudoalteromonas sp. N1230-9]
MVNINELHSRIECINSIDSFNKFFKDIKNTYSYTQVGFITFDFSDLFRFDTNYFGEFEHSFLDEVHSCKKLIHYCLNETKALMLSEINGNYDSVLIVPTGLHKNKFACLVLELPNLSTEPHKAKMLGDYWRIFLIEMFEAYRRSTRTEAVKITRREKECIKWASIGKTSWEISQILNISQRTVDFHLSNCIKKTSSTNRQQAIVKCILNGELLA